MVSPLPAKQDFLGTIVQRRSVPGVRLTETELPEHSRTPRHAHDRPLIGWSLHGSYTNQYTRGSQDVQSSRIMFCPAGEVHTTFSPLGAVSFALELESGWADRFGEVSLPECPTLYEAGSLASLMQRLHHEFSETDMASSLAIEGMVLEMIAIAMRFRSDRTAAAPRWLLEAKERLDETFREPITITGLAHQVQIHPVYLATTFRQKYGNSIVGYVRELRVHYACQQLADTEYSLAEIAQAAGFSDQSHFSRIFKRVTNMTPAAYRAIARRD